MTRIMEDVTSVERVLIDGIEQGVVAVLQVVIVTSVMFYLNAKLALFALAPFPFLILLYAWWKRGRVDRSDIKAAAPFLTVSVVLAFMTIWAGKHYISTGHSQPEEQAKK